MAASLSSRQLRCKRQRISPPAIHPFAKVGLFASVEIRPWLWVFNKPSDEDE
jgi:hypothetical protein